MDEINKYKKAFIDSEKENKKFILNFLNLLFLDVKTFKLRIQSRQHQASIIALENSIDFLLFSSFNSSKKPNFL